MPVKEKKTKPMASKTIKAIELIDKGVDIQDAHKLATGIENPHPRTLYDLKKKYDAYLLSKKSTVKLASKVFVNAMKMKPVETEEVKICPQCKGRSQDPKEPMCVTCKGSGVVNTLIYPTHTNALAAAEAVMDRIDPVIKQSMNLNVSANFTDVNLESFG